MRRLAPVLLALAAAAAVLMVYGALGGGRYAPREVADPCLTRDAGSGGGTSGTLQRIAFATVDGAACTLGVSRETLVLALRDQEAFEKFSASNGITRADAEQVLATSLGDGIDAAEKAGDLPGFVAGLMRALVGRTPPWLLFDVLDRLRGLVT